VHTKSRRHDSRRIGSRQFLQAFNPGHRL